MQTLYLIQSGTKVKRKDHRLLITTPDQQTRSILIGSVARVMVQGRVEISAEAMKLLMAHRISVIHATGAGKIIGITSPVETPRVATRRNQYRLCEEGEYRTDFCRSLVTAKAANMIHILKRFAYNHPELPCCSMITQRTKQINYLARKVVAYSRPESLRGLEGVISREYFAAFGTIVQTDEMCFNGRSKRPPRDEINALLSYAYVLLTGYCCFAIGSTDLDLYLGFMHEPIRSAPALALDFVEQFRQPIVDQWVMTLVHRRQFGATDFHKGPNEGIFLTKPAIRRFLALWEEHLITPKRRIKEEKPISPRDLLFRHAQQLCEAITKNQPYSPFCYKGSVK